MNTFKYADNFPSQPVPPYDQDRYPRAKNNESQESTLRRGRLGRGLAVVATVAAISGAAIGLAKMHENNDGNPSAMSTQADVERVQDQQNENLINSAVASGQNPEDISQIQ